MPMTDFRLSGVPALSWPAELLLQAQGIQVAFFDVDGVLTDGGLYFAEFAAGDSRATPDGPQAGETIKRFHTLDGHGLKLLQRAGITPAVITGRDSRVLRARLQALGITHVHYGTEDKAPAAQAVLNSLGLDWHRPQPSVTTGPTWRCCAAAALPVPRPTPTPRCWRGCTMSPAPPVARARRANSATCCWWPAATMPRCWSTA